MSTLNSIAAMQASTKNDKWKPREEIKHPLKKGKYLFAEKLKNVTKDMLIIW